MVIRRLAHDLNFNLEVVICPIVRESDGLALSSRNTRLTDQQRKAAIVLNRALLKAKENLLDGEKNADTLRLIMVNTIQNEPLARLDYASVADPETLDELAGVERRALLSLAVFFGEVRLIDNMLVEL